MNHKVNIIDIAMKEELIKIPCDMLIPFDIFKPCYS